MQVVARSDQCRTDDAPAVDMHGRSLIRSRLKPQETGTIGNQPRMQRGHAGVSQIDLRARIGSDTKR